MKKLILTLTLAFSTITSLFAVADKPWHWAEFALPSRNGDEIQVWDQWAWPSGKWVTFIRTWHESPRYGLPKQAVRAFCFDYPSWLNDGPLYPTRYWGYIDCYYETYSRGQLTASNGLKYWWSFTADEFVQIPGYLCSGIPFYRWPGDATVRP